MALELAGVLFFTQDENVNTHFCTSDTIRLCFTLSHASSCILYVPSECHYAMAMREH